MNRFSDYQFKRSGLWLRNRLVVPPMASQTASADGRPTARTIEHYARLARSGAGLIWVEYTAVHPSGRGEPRQTMLADDTAIEAFAQVAWAIRQSGARAGLQLVHAGGKSTRELTAGDLQGPSAVAVPVKGRELEVPREMTARDLWLWKESFEQAADRAARAGFQWLELHAAHGYGLNQFLSPLTNRREDDYGGTTANRARLLFEIAARLRRLHPRRGLAVRLPGQDHLPGGLTREDSVWIARELGRIGVDLIDVSSGLGGWRRTDSREDEGYLVEDAAFLRARSGQPVIGVGGVKTGAYMDRVIADGAVDLVAVGRSILEDPERFRKTQMEVSDEDNSFRPFALADGC